ncbi:MAG TPA: tetratricopeptide repeat protein [Syntrophorhabdaceae bacterium]|nr:tetratricopeptide repeat protein [Syntrophorhabdaceae bacterium]
MTIRKSGIKKILLFSGFFFAAAALSVLCACNVAYLEKFGEFDASQGNYEEALKDYDKAIRYNPKDPVAYAGRGYVYQKMGNHEKAIADYTRAIELDPADDELYLIRGLAYFLKGDNDRAITDYSKAIEVDPSNSDAYLNRAQSYELKGNKEQAVKDYQGAARLGNARAQGILQGRRIAW